MLYFRRMSNYDTRAHEGHGGFPSTHWSMVLQAREPAATGYRDSMEALVKAYWRPIYVYIRASWSRSNEDAKDLTQEFLTRLFERGLVEGYDKEKGRFRAYLKGALKHFLLDQERAESRQKRGGGKSLISLDEGLPSVPDGGGAPEELFDRAWAQTLLDRALDEVREDLRRRGRERCWIVFDRYTLQGAESEELTYHKMGEELGITAEQVKGDLKYARLLTRQAIERLVADSVSSKEDLYGELKDLFE